MVQADQVGNVLSGDQGVLSGAAAGTVVVDGGNCDPTVSRRPRGPTLPRLAYPYSTPGAAAGPTARSRAPSQSWSAEDRAAYDRCLPVFQAVGGQIAYMGPSGNGHLAKVVNNMITKMTDFVIAESLTLGLKAGLDVAAMLDVLTTGAARSWILSQAGELFHEEEESRYQPTFTDTPRPNMEAANQLIWGVRMAGELGVPVPMDRPRNRAHEVGPLRRPLRGVQGPPRKLVYKHAGEHIDSPPT